MSSNWANVLSLRLWMQPQYQVLFMISQLNRKVRASQHQICGGIWRFRAENIAFAKWQCRQDFSLLLRSNLIDIAQVPLACACLPPGLGPASEAESFNIYLPKSDTDAWSWETSWQSGKRTYANEPTCFCLFPNMAKLTPYTQGFFFSRNLWVCRILEENLWGKVDKNRFLTLGFITSEKVQRIAM